MYIHLATKSAQVLTSPSVYKMAVGLPVVPEEACRRTMEDIGSVKNPYGYPARRSSFVVRGRS
jgi:hypothetical protein